MISTAAGVLDRAASGIDVSDELNEIPAYQWEIYWEELAPLCPMRLVIPLERRRANALNIELIQPMDRCISRRPENWPPSASSALRWLASGGEKMVFGLCSIHGCPRITGKWSDVVEPAQPKEGDRG